MNTRNTIVMLALLVVVYIIWDITTNRVEQMSDTGHSSESAQYDNKQSNSQQSNSQQSNSQQTLSQRSNNVARSEPDQQNIPGRTSIMNARMREHNLELAMKCGRIFNGYPELIRECTTEDGIHLRYAVEIDNAHAIWEQNYRDDVRWRPEMYLEIVRGKPENIICEVIYPIAYETGCRSMSEGMRREAWEQYWAVRRAESNNWQLPEFRTRLR